MRLPARDGGRPNTGRTVMLVAGASGSGKSRLAGVIGCPRLSLDHFYFDWDRPGLPRAGPIADWDDVASWDARAARRAAEELLETGRTSVPDYDIAQSRRLGYRPMELAEHRLFVAEGIFAIDLLAPIRAAGMNVVPIWLDRNRSVTAARRLRRDVAEKRKPLLTLLRRGAALWRAEPALRRRAIAAGFRPLSMGEARALAARLQR